MAKEYAFRQEGFSVICRTFKPCNMCLHQFHTPLGYIEILTTATRAVSRVKFIQCSHRTRGYNPLESSPVKSQIMRYLNGRSFDFRLSTAISATPFEKRVWQIVCSIPYGETRTYKQVACALGISKGAQAVGNALKKNPLLLIIPCHRVVSSKVHSLGGYQAGVEIKQKLISLENNTPTIIRGLHPHIS
jgi:O-6-methylguanine DNA methyltransferase